MEPNQPQGAPPPGMYPPQAPGMYPPPPGGMYPPPGQVMYAPMPVGGRPGGLTALAVLNFIGGGFMVLATLLGLSSIMKYEDAKDTYERALRILGTAAKDFPAFPSKMGVMVNWGLGAVIAVLLIVSGVGYLKMSKTLGYVMGNAYAAASLLGVVLGIVMMGLGVYGILSVILGSVYPLITLSLLNNHKAKFT